MTLISSLVTDIEAVLQDADTERRTLLLDRITNLFIEQLPDLNDDHLAVFDEVILCLALEIEVAARIQLSEKLADLTRGPRQTVQNLALDREIRVARPVLERSPCVDDADLRTVAETRSDSFLDALSRRSSLPSMVTDLLAERGNETVLHRLMENPNFTLSETGLRILADRATTDSRLYRALKSRPDLATRHIGALLEAAKQKARAELTGLTDRSELIDEAVNVGAAAVLVNPALLELSDATRSIDHTAIIFSRPPKEEEIITLIHHGRLAEALSAIAYLAGLPRDKVRAAFSSPHFDPLLFIIRAIDLQWSTCAALLNARSGGSVSASQLENAQTSFHTLSLATARRVLKFISVRTVA